MQNRICSMLHKRCAMNSRKQHKSICFILILSMLFLGMCFENIEADSSLAYQLVSQADSTLRSSQNTSLSRQIYMEDLEGWADSIVCTTTEQADFVRKFLQVMEQNLDREDLGSTFVAEQMLMSSRQFYRKFKEISGMSPSDLIKDYRMEKAARLLQNEELSIQDVISDVGISSRAYFYKEFTRKFGVTPKVYREKLLGNDTHKNQE